MKLKENTPKFKLYRTKLYGTAALMGALLASVGDMSHVLTGTIVYPVDYGFYIGVLPFWVPLEMGLAVALGTAMQEYGDYLLGRRGWMTSHSRVTFSSVFISGVVFLGIYILSGILSSFLSGLFAANFILITLAVLLFWIFDRTKQGAIYALITATCGTVFEILFSSTGAFYYQERPGVIFGVPSWLPVLYVAISIVIHRLRRAFSNFSGL